MLSRDSGRAEPDFVFVGWLRNVAGRLEISGPTGVVTVRGSSSELSRVAELLQRTAAPHLVDIDAEHYQLLVTLEEVGAVVMPGRAWFWFHIMSSNPPVTHVSTDPLDAYAMPRTRMDGIPVARRDVGLLAPVSAVRRRSADLALVRPNPQQSLDAALSLAQDCYRLDQDGRRPVASGGALYPLHMWVVGANGSEGKRSVFAIDHDDQVNLRQGELDLDDLRAMFVFDPALDQAIGAGAAAIFIGVDPRRTTHKYGNRGWRYALMEVGAVSHHMALAAAQSGVDLRPIGGFYDERVLDAITKPLLPLHVLVISQEARDR